MTRACVLAGLILLGILAGMLLRPAAARPVVHTVALGQRDVQDVVLDAPIGRAFLLAATLRGIDDISAVQMLDLGTRAVRRTVAVGTGSPITLALDERTQRLFALTEPSYCGPCYVFVLDARTGSIVRTTRVGLYPAGVAVDTLTDRVFVANTDSVSMLDAHTGVLRRTIAVGGFPGLGVTGANFPGVTADTRTGRIFVTDTDGAPLFTGAGRIDVLDGTSGDVLSTVPLGLAPVSVTLDTRTGRAVVVDGGDTRRLPDPWSWVPSWARSLMPFLPPPRMRTQTVPASVSVVATTP